MKQVLSLRQSPPRGSFGSEEDRERFEAACVQALKTQTCRYAVPPGRRLKTPTGRVLEAGEEVLPEWWANWREFDQLVARLAILDSGEPEPDAILEPEEPGTEAA